MERIAITDLTQDLDTKAIAEAHAPAPVELSQTQEQPTPFSALTTKKARIAFIKEKLGTSKAWAAKGLVRIFEGQTQDEQRQDTTCHHNGVGFTAFDAELLSSFAKQFIQRGGHIKLANRNPEYASALSERQWSKVFHLMPKYAAQLHNLITH